MNYTMLMPAPKNKKRRELWIERRIKATKGKPLLANRGESNGMWKGDQVGYSSLHEWVRKRKPRPALCEECQQRPPIDLANVSGEYSRDLDDWRWLCRHCHMVLDGRIGNLKQYKER